MKSKQKIYMDFRRAKEAAERLDGVAENLLRSADSEMQTVMDNLSAAWKCTASSAFRSKEEQMKTNIKQSATALRTLADKIRNDAYRIYQAEMRAYELASREQD